MKHPSEYTAEEQAAWEEIAESKGLMTTPKPSAPREFDEMTVDGVCIENMDQPTPAERQFFCDGARWQFEQDRAAYETLQEEIKRLKFALEMYENPPVRREDIT